MPVLRVTCPKCGHVNERDMSDGGPVSSLVICRGCRVRIPIAHVPDRPPNYNTLPRAEDEEKKTPEEEAVHEVRD